MKTPRLAVVFLALSVAAIIGGYQAKKWSLERADFAEREVAFQDLQEREFKSVSERKSRRGREAEGVNLRSTDTLEDLLALENDKLYDPLALCLLDATEDDIAALAHPDGMSLLEGDYLRDSEDNFELLLDKMPAAWSGDVTKLSRSILNGTKNAAKWLDYDWESKGFSGKDVQAIKYNLLGNLSEKKPKDMLARIGALEMAGWRKNELMTRALRVRDLKPRTLCNI